MPRERDNTEPRQEPALSVKDLIIAAASSAVAALIVSQVWRSGTLIATAMTPVIVTVVRELLARPKTVASQAAQAARAVTPVAPHLPRSSRFSRRERFSDRSRRPAAERDQEDFDPVQPGGWDDLGRQPGGAGAPLPPEPPDERRERRQVRREDDRQRRWRRKAIVLGVVGGLAGCIIAVATITLTEVAVFGKNASSAASSPTTFFSGSSTRDRNRDEKRDASKDEPKDSESENKEATPTPTPDATPTPTPDATATPTPEATPTPAPAPAEGDAPTAPTPAPTPAP